MFSQRPTRAEIDLAALRHNYAALKSCAGAGVEVIPVVKADAYGHGAPAVAAALAAVGVPGFAVATVSEAKALKDAGIKDNILILGALYKDDLPQLARGGIVPVLWDRESAQCLSQFARQRQLTLAVQIKIDTGMGRAGVAESDALDFIAMVKALPGLQLVGLLSHLAVADGDADWQRAYTGQQAQRFAEVCAGVASFGSQALDRHLANSAALVRYKFPFCNQARAGIALYGSYPDEGLRDKIDLRPVMTVKSGIVLLKSLQPGQSVSYGCTYTAREKITLALLPIGYADGLRRALSGRGVVLVRGRRAPLVGRICMDWTMADVTAIAGVRVGDEVVLMGAQGEQAIRAEELAATLDTISYEVFCGWSSRVRRQYINAAKQE
ncbi:MAG: alanine racemase [Deltaproteobacteria bacterium]|nr:alanine racemase [Deltaproteobacteria bacterium]